MIPGGEQRKHEAPDLEGMMRRMLRALVRRAAEGDLECLESLCRLEDAARVATTVAMYELHECARYSYTDIGRAMGVSRQAARQRVDACGDGGEDGDEVAYFLS